MNLLLQEQRTIINSKPFRRLADKTQVITSIDRNAQTRTRLTHTLEVASIAQEISSNIKNIGEYELNPLTTYNVSLLHDIAMSPLGHLGEQTLNKVVNKLFGLHFEANAQNINVIEEKFENISPLTIGLTIKYPFLIKENEKGKGLYEKQFKKYEPILNETIKLQNQNPNIARMRTYECEIMEISDDLAYLFSDLEDYISLIKKDEDLINKNQLTNLFTKYKLNNPNLFFTLYEAITQKDIKKLESIRNEVINEVKYNSSKNLIEVQNEEYKKLLNIIRDIDWNYYITKKSLTENSKLIKEYEEMLLFVFNNIKNKTIIENFIYSKTKLLQYNTKLEENIDEIGLAKVVLVSMSELTDTYAIKLIQKYKKL